MCMATCYQQGYPIKPGILVYLYVMEAKSRKKFENPDVKKGESKEEVPSGSTNGSLATGKPFVTKIKKTKKNHVRLCASDSGADEDWVNFRNSQMASMNLHDPM